MRVLVRYCVGACFCVVDVCACSVCLWVCALQLLDAVRGLGYESEVVDDDDEVDMMRRQHAKLVRQHTAPVCVCFPQ